MQKSFILLITGILLWSFAGSAVALIDVQGSPYTAAYAYLEEKGAVQSGRPNDLLNRVEALKIALEANEQYRSRLEWFKEHRSSLPLFRDVNQAAWYAAYIETGFEAGIMSGYGDRSFRPGTALRAEEAIALLLRAYGIRASENIGQPTWYEPYVRIALDRNLVSSRDQLWVGYGITRGQFVEMVYRLATIQSSNQVAFAEPNVPATVAGVDSRRILLPHEQPTLVAQRSGRTGRPKGIVTPVPVSAPVASAGSFSISIPKLGISNLTVTHPRDALTSKGQLEVLKNGVGHLFSYPGRGGKIMIYGHSGSYSWDVSKYTKIFTRVNELKPGDRVTVTFNGTQYVYEVTGHQTIAPNDITPFTGRGEELILYTCWPVGSAKSRWIVRATPVETVALR